MRLSHLEFAKNSFRRRIYRRTQKALRRDLFAVKQKWLGTFFAKEIQSGAHPPVEVRWIDERIGYGVFAGSSLAKGAYVGEYTGVVRKRKKNDENGYCFQYNIGDDWNSPFIIDAKERGNYTRFINHDAQGNLEPVAVYLDGMMHIILIALRPIKKGEQLCYDYGDDYWTYRKRVPVPLTCP
jgi:SET domain-containing protein